MKRKLFRRMICLALALVMLGGGLSANAISYTSYIDDIMDTFVSVDDNAESAVQQVVNGTYRTVELLSLIARKLA